MDEGHEDQSRAFDKAAQSFNFNVFSAGKDRSKSWEREVKNGEAFPKLRDTSIRAVTTTFKCSYGQAAL